MKVMPYFSESGLEIAYGTDEAAGLDLPYYDPEREAITIAPGQREALPTGIYCEFPEGFYGFLDSRSSTSKLKLDLLCRTIDGDYRGNIHTVVINNGDKAVTVRRGEFLFQMVMKERVEVTPLRVGAVDHLAPSKRGANGFGHTGGSQVANGNMNMEGK